ncbi:hypothetical protein F4802DRAFT_597854 [Xylaria palmicola]|nr:hypothetical protein F4802DRAFT_597854 [Xylaria palmicola]
MDPSSFGNIPRRPVVSYYKWKGRYYVHKRYSGVTYAASEPHLSIIGKELVDEIPSSPGEYQAWLQRKRSELSDLAKKLERVFTISMETFGESPDRQDFADHDLMPNGDHLPPETNWFRIWVYVFDLDREILGIQGMEIQGKCCYHLSKIPPHFFDIKEDARNYWLGSVRHNEVHKSITTDRILPTPLADNPTPAFLQLKPTMVHPRHESRLNRMPAFVVCKRLYELFIRINLKYIIQAHDSHFESDFLFKELVFALICFASCSPAYVRLVSSRNVKTILNKGHRSGSVTDPSEWIYGTIFDHGVVRKPKEFIKRFIRGYHLQGMETGSAPTLTSYWFSGALVYLRRDITSRKKLQSAIISAVAKGKADGQTHFNAIIVSLKHFVLLKFANGNVQHTKRLNLGVYPDFVQKKVTSEKSDEEDGAEEEPNEEESTEAKESFEKKENAKSREESRKDGREPEKTTHNHSDDSNWADNAHVAAFDILAHFFNATQKQGLRPSMVYNEGVFPNEVYQRILRYVNSETSIACLQVSRFFREFASETYIMDDGLKVVFCPGKEPECIHKTLGRVGSFKIVPCGEWWTFGLTREECPIWVPVFGMPDGSASIENIVLGFSSLLPKISVPSFGLLPYNLGLW